VPVDTPRPRRADTPAAGCRRCPRLVALRHELGATYPSYHGASVTAVGPVDAALLVVGLAPGLHGAHRTGRPFSGDDSGGLLFEMLHAYGWANQPVSTGPGDGLVLHDCRITNAVKCLPPNNRPTASERRACNGFLRAELRAPRVIIALGRLAHDAVIAALNLRPVDHRFVHARVHRLDRQRVLVDSYHCSRYNLNTRRLTRDGFAAVFAQARRRFPA